MGILGNAYSRIYHGVAVIALLPAIFVQVPSGIAASGSLIQGLSSAETLNKNSTYANGTSRVTGTNQVSMKFFFLDTIRLRCISEVFY